jgi:hypothetical protein
LKFNSSKGLRKEIIVTVNPLPSLTVNATPTTVCAGSSVTLSASGAVNYTWNPMGAPGASIVTNPTITTTYNSIIYIIQ